MADWLASGISTPLGLRAVRGWTDLVLVKMALEGKGFQAARAEALDTSQAPQEDPQEVHAMHPTSPQAATSPPFAVTWLLDIRQTTLHVDREDGTGSRSVEVTQTQVRVAAGASPQRSRDPLVISLDGGMPHTTGEAGARPFDLTGDAQPSPTSFVAGRTAFLALDRNRNGRIDDGRELFGDQHGAANGFEELRRFDTNRDAILDGNDAVFPALRLWFGDGSLSTLEAVGISALDLQDRPVAALTIGGDEIFREALASLAHGGTVGTYALNLASFEGEA